MSSDDDEYDGDVEAGHFFCSLDLDCPTNIVASLHNARYQGFSCVVAPLVHPRYQRSFERDEPFTRSDLLLSSSQWSCVIAKFSPWLNFDSIYDSVRAKSLKAFQQELEWAVHLSISTVVVPTPSFHSPNLSAAISGLIHRASHLNVWVPIPLMPRESHFHEGEYSLDRRNDPWEWWNNLRSHCEHSPSLHVALELTENLPPRVMLDRWLGEPVRAAIVNTSIFLTNKHGYPTLSRPHQAFVMQLFKHKVHLILSGTPYHKRGMGPYKDYLQYLYRKQPRLTSQEAFEAPYLDYLQAPLQPLMDNLESQTYETFERDPIKYAQYEEAVRRALSDTPKEKVSVVMVVGAGRGPLVAGVLRGAANAGRQVRVYAVEKNPNAVVTLRNRQRSEWGDRVQVVSSDMRVWDAPEKADILVSELLGSFGDNELSPECLDGAQKFLKDDGISIPCAYTSFLAPISSSKLYNEVRSFGERKHFETSYVVKLHNFWQLAPSAECFTFVHPNRSDPIDNSRYCSNSWTCPAGATIHGFVGYFDAKLYKDVHISIDPATFSEGMISWFPIYFPIRDPVYVPEGARVEVHFWRKVAASKVWYEWSLTEPMAGPIHNAHGRSQWIGT